MSNWPFTTLKEAGVSLLDCDHKTPKAQKIGLPYIGIPQLKNGRVILDGARLISLEDFDHWRRKARPIANDVIMSRRCNPGEIAFVPEKLEIALGQNLVLLRSNGEKVFPPFLRWITQGPNWWRQVNAFINVGAVFDSLKCADIPKFEFRLPPIEVQKRIAKTLGELDRKIELNHQINQTLEQIAQAIFKSWFVDFEPTRAKIAAKKRWLALNEIIETSSPTCYSHEFDTDKPNTQSLDEAMTQAAMAAISGKTPEELSRLSEEQQQHLRGVAALFPDTLVDSELGEIPAGWGVTELGNILEFNPKRILKKGELAPYLDMKNVPTQGHLADEIIIREMASGTKFINGDTLLARITPCLENGKTAFVDFLEQGQVAWGSTEYIVMRPKGKRPMSLGYILARLDSFRSKAIQSMTGTSGRQRADAKANGDQNEILGTLRNTLLPKLLSGELTLEDTKIEQDAPC